jgi:spermidine synthase
MQQRLSREDHAAVMASLLEAGFRSVDEMLATYAGQAQDLRPWLIRAPLNRDRDLRLQYLAGFGLNLYQGDAIYRSLLQYRRFPDERFTAPESWKQALKSAMGLQK